MIDLDIRPLPWVNGGDGLSAPESGDEGLSMRDAAYQSIKHRILTCALKPGEYVNEAQLCTMFGAGRTPVRQALERLRLESLVEVIPRKGVIVKSLSLDEVRQIIEVRLFSETYSARLAAERADAGEISQMKELLERARKVLADSNVTQMMLLDRDFHLMLSRATKNVVFSEILQKLHDRSLRFWVISLQTPHHHVRVWEEHSAIVDAVADHNLVGAEAAMRAHIESFRANIVSLL